MFPDSFIREGHVVASDCSVRVFEDRYSCRFIANIPGGRIRCAYWQGNQVHVVLEDGYHYVYDDFNSMVSSWKEKA